jgi:hypothetical protein
MAEQQPSAPELKVPTWEEFLTNTPPSTIQLVSGVTTLDGRMPAVPGAQYRYVMVLPTLYLPCTSKKCKSEYRYFDCFDKFSPFKIDEILERFLTYTCRNCAEYTKTIAIGIEYEPHTKLHKAYKYGELPPYGPMTPAKTMNFMGRDWDMYFQGRRSEFQGFGIGALSYYRRIVENKKDDIIDMIINVVKKVNPESTQLLTELLQAKKQTQFSKAIESIKQLLPTNLLINGHNPLTLLHDAMSDGVHNLGDAECLESSVAIRTILEKFIEQIHYALKEEKEVRDAISGILQKQAERNRKKST